MCLAVPGKVVELFDAQPPFASGLVEFAGVRRPVSLACVPEAREGDYVLVHAGLAISHVDATDAHTILAMLQACDQLNQEERP